MATQAATQILAKGPLSTALGQWMFLGFGTFVIFTGDNGVSKAAQEIAGVAFRLVTGRDGGFSATSLLREAALGGSSGQNDNLRNGGGQSQQQPIVIHSVSSSSDGKNGGYWTTTLIQMGIGAGACWGAYILFSNFLPDQIKEMLPVTRKFFESAVTSLGQGILRVRDALSEQIAVLGIKQDELATKQDETTEHVLGIKDDVGDVRLQVDDIAVAISRCENSLTDAEGRQTYMSRGVRLLVQCVGDLLRPSNPGVAEELDQFSRLSAELMDDDFHYQESRGGSRRNDGRSSPNKGGRQLEYPSSPNLSEIGSTTSTVIEDNMRSLSLPRPRRSQSVVTPSSNQAPSSTSKVPMSRHNSSPYGTVALKILESMNRRNSSTATTASSTSSPENEHPLSSNPSSGQVTPYGSDATDPVSLDEVDELLRIVRNGGNPLRV